MLKYLLVPTSQHNVGPMAQAVLSFSLLEMYQVLFKQQHIKWKQLQQ